MQNIKKKLLLAAFTFGVGIAAFDASARIIVCKACTCSGDTCVCTGCQ